MIRGLCFALILTGVLPGQATAQFERDSSAPIEISADTMEWMNEERIAIARGQADAIQGRYHLRANTLIAHLSRNERASADNILWIEADGDVLLVTPAESAQGKVGIYDVVNKFVTLEGDVILTQGDNVVRGERLVMDLRTGVSTLDGGPASENAVMPSASDRRVRAIFTVDEGSNVAK